MIKIVHLISRFKLKLVLTVSVLFGMIGSSAVFAAYPGISNDQVDTVAGITLHQDIHGNRGSRIHIQHGKVVNSVYELIPYCYFRLNRNYGESNTPVNIQATTFQITDIRNQGRHVQLEPFTTTGMQFASFGFGDGGSANQLTLATTFNLSDPNQPQVKHLVCAIWSDPRDRSYLKLNEIHDVLGDLVSVPASSGY